MWWLLLCCGPLYAPTIWGYQFLVDISTYETTAGPDFWVAAGPTAELDSKQAQFWGSASVSMEYHRSWPNLAISVSLQLFYFKRMAIGEKLPMYVASRKCPCVHTILFQGNVPVYMQF